MKALNTFYLFVWWRIRTTGWSGYYYYYFSKLKAVTRSTDRSIAKPVSLQMQLANSCGTFPQVVTTIQCCSNRCVELGKVAGILPLYTLCCVDWDIYWHLRNRNRLWECQAAAVCSTKWHFVAAMYPLHPLQLDGICYPRDQYKAFNVTTKLYSPPISYTQCLVEFLIQFFTKTWQELVY